MHRHVFRQDAVLDKTDHTILRILVKLSWHIPGFPIYSNGTKPRTLHSPGVCRPRSTLGRRFRSHGTQGAFRKGQSRVSFIHNRVNAHKQAVIDDWNAGRISLSERQMAHCRAEGWPKAMHRGTAMDQALKQRIENDKNPYQIGSFGCTPR